MTKTGRKGGGLNRVKVREGNKRERDQRQRMCSVRRNSKDGIGGLGEALEKEHQEKERMSQNFIL